MKWTIEKLQKEANKYETRIEFQKNSKAYSTAKNKKILNELFKNHSNEGYNNFRKKDGFWTIERLQEEVNKYKTRLEFQKKSTSAYGIAHVKKNIDFLFKNHFNNGYDINRLSPGYWTIEKLQEDVNKYKTRNEFYKKSSSAYTISIQKGLIDELFKNHTNLGYSKKEWQENSYIIYAYELPKYNRVYVGLTNNIERRDKEHVFDKKEKLNLFCKENKIPYPEYKILEKNLKSIDAQNKENYWINFYKNNEWIMFNIAKSGSLGGYIKKWTKKKLQEEANKYKTRGEFWIKSKIASVIAGNKNIIDELFINHQNSGYSENRVHRDHWSEEILQNEANKYLTRFEFKKNNYVAYKAAHRKKLLNNIFKNHKNKGYTRNFKIKEQI
jgi:hypothetical protein